MAQPQGQVPAVVAAPAVAPNQAAPPQPQSAAPAPAPPAQGAAQPVPAPAQRRNRVPQGPIPLATNVNASPGVPALLEIAAANGFHTHLRREENQYVPSAVHMFACLNVCDLMMANTHRFLQSAPMWLPIVSHLYFSVLWFLTIIRARVSARYGSPDENQLYEDLINYLQLDNAMIPGPLVPFFQSLAATSAAFDWLGDFMPGLPAVPYLFENANPCFRLEYMHKVPFPAVLLDALIWFSRVPAGANSTHGAFEWMRNVFGDTVTANPASHAFFNRSGPNFVASLYCTASQFDNARAFWSGELQNVNRYARYTSAQASAMMTFAQLLGFADANSSLKLSWFTHIAQAMQSYSHYFNGSVPLKAIAPVGISACIPRGIPENTTAVRDWYYWQVAPAATTSGSMQPIHALPARFGIVYSHADHDLEEVAEQYAIISAVNLDFSVLLLTQHAWPQTTHNMCYSGSAWQMLSHRETSSLSIHNAYAQTIAARYHQTTALRRN